MTSAKGAFGSEFKVGETVYFISSKSEQVVPALVIEKITRSSLGCDVRVTYVLKVIGAKGSFKEVEVDPLKVELFNDPELIKDFMLKRTTDAIEKLVQAAVDAATRLRPEQPQQPEFVPLESDPQPSEPVEVVLPDGKVAKLRM